MVSRRPRTPAAAATPKGSEDTEEMETLRRQLYHERRLSPPGIAGVGAFAVSRFFQYTTQYVIVDGGELQMRLEAQLAVNEHLENTKQWLEMEIITGSYEFKSRLAHRQS
ncbi:hypothetical protein B566_EDAN013211 [Ephemera danica]|nr:hypothetical protein B566_EDAN013211 [Ephemera danica]